LIDDIIRPPSKKQRPAIARTTTNTRPRRQNPVDHQIRLTQPRLDSQPRQQTIPSTAQRQKVTQESSKTKRQRTVRKRLLRLEKYILLVAAPLVILGTVRVSKHAAIGEAIIAAYALGVVVFKIPSRVTFWLVSMFLVSIPAVLLSVPDIRRSHTTALYAFMLMGVGLLSLILETRRLEVRERRFR
jgi:hypothetical protein